MSTSRRRITSTETAAPNIAMGTNPLQTSLQPGIAGTTFTTTTNGDNIQVEHLRDHFNFNRGWEPTIPITPFIPNSTPETTLREGGMPIGVQQNLQGDIPATTTPDPLAQALEDFVVVDAIQETDTTNTQVTVDEAIDAYQQRLLELATEYLMNEIRGLQARINSGAGPVTRMELRNRIDRYHRFSREEILHFYNSRTQEGRGTVVIQERKGSNPTQKNWDAIFENNTYNPKPIKKKVEEVNDTEEVIINFNELADTFAKEKLKEKYGEYNPETMIDEWNDLTKDYSEIILKHKRKVDE